LNNLGPSFRTSSFQPLLGFQAGLFPPQFPYRIRFWNSVVESRHYTTTRYYQQIKFWKLFVSFTSQSP
jgi:hypothetical protein